MTQRSHVAPFIWYELTTPDANAAAAFYAEVAGWEARRWPDGAVAYTVLSSAQGPVAGVSAKADAPSRWTGLLKVDDVDRTIARAVELGGRVGSAAVDVPSVGRVGAIAEPGGGQLGLLAPAPQSTPMQPHDPTRAGEFCWNELLTADHEVTFGMCQTLFGWEKVRDFAMGPAGNYLIFGANGREIGGMFSGPESNPRVPTWFHYIHVDDLDAAVSRANAAGGKLLAGPMPVPGGARVAQLIDPQGAVFALHADS